MDDFYLKAGLRIRELREMNRYTREQFSEMTDISPKFLYEIEAGRKGFSANVLYKISKALNVSCDYILNDSNQQTVPDFIIELVKKLDSKEQVAVEHILVEIIRLREE